LSVVIRVLVANIRIAKDNKVDASVAGKLKDDRVVPRTWNNANAANNKRIPAPGLGAASRGRGANMVAATRRIPTNLIGVMGNCPTWKS
jgi:hypothetical protein